MKVTITTLAAVVAVFMGVELYLALVWSPPEASMHELVRIMYFHVSSAWTAMVAYVVTFVCSVVYLWKRSPSMDAIALCSTEIGLVYTTFTLITGSLWAKSYWGAWWTWDPRLTLTLILWFLFIGYMLLRGSIATLERRALVGAVYAIIACIDVPIIHVSVTLWRSIHPNTINATGFNMPFQMEFTLVFGFVAFFALYILILSLRVRTQLAHQRLYRMRQQVRDVIYRLEGGM